MFWVICYDIPDDKRRRKIQKILEGYGRRVQYSVFECEISNAKLERLHKQLRRVINEQEDDIRFYPLNQADLKLIGLMGRAVLERTRSVYIIGQ